MWAKAPSKDGLRRVAFPCQKRSVLTECGVGPGERSSASLRGRRKIIPLAICWGESRMPRGGKRHITSEVFASIIKAYLASPKFQGLGWETQRNYHRYLILAEHPDCLGSVPVDAMRPALVQAFLDGLSDRPGAQSVAQVALKALEKWAVVRDLLPRSITMGTEVIGSNGGHVPWNNEEVALAE